MNYDWLKVTALRRSFGGFNLFTGAGIGWEMLLLLSTPRCWLSPYRPLSPKHYHTPQGTTLHQPTPASTRHSRHTLPEGGVSLMAMPPT